MKIIRRILWALLLLFLAGAFIGLGYYYAVTKDVRLNPEKLVLNEKTVVLYDGNGSAVKHTASMLKQTVKISDIPDHTKQAFTDVEDKRFYRHNGFDVKRIVGAAFNNLRAGAFKEGASTISQQLIKNTHLTQEKTLKRKLKEWKLTRQLEKKYSKEEILEKYLNTIYFGHSCFGLRSAAEFYFDKSVNELTIADSAILAGLVKSPNNYSPFRNPEKCVKRKETVLNLMFSNGHIDAKQKQEAINAPLPQSSPHKQHGGYLSFVFDELTEIAEEKKFSIGGKIEIATYLDQNLQTKLEEVAAMETNCGKTILVLDAQNHGFKGGISTVGNIKRLPGSLIKPLLVYTPALEEDILVPATPILDEKVNYGGYSPENYDRQYHGYVSARECVEKSLNIPAVKVLESLGIKKSVNYMQKLNLRIDKEDESLALALGGMKNGFTLQDITEGYSVLQNGTLQKNGFIKTIKINGSLVYEKANTPRRVFSKESAYLMTDMLKSTAKNGTAKKLRGLPFEIAAKTGTVGTDNGNTDAYALSYTTRDCVAVWLGNADNSKIEYTGGGLPCNLLLDINEYIYNGYKSKKQSIPAFTPPETIVNVALDKTTYYDTHTISLADEQSPLEYRFHELFKKSAMPLNKSDSFTNPTINPPTLRFENGKVIIQLGERAPRFYTYKIERHDYATHTTLYQGEYLKEFIDDHLEEGKTYVYTVTPIYRDYIGKTISLPSVSTAKNEIFCPEDHEILSKEWWDY